MSLFFCPSGSFPLLLLLAPPRGIDFGPQSVLWAHQNKIRNGRRRRKGKKKVSREKKTEERQMNEMEGREIVAKALDGQRYLCPA